MLRFVLVCVVGVVGGACDRWRVKRNALAEHRPLCLIDETSHDKPIHQPENRAEFGIDHITIKLHPIDTPVSATFPLNQPQLNELW